MFESLRFSRDAKRGGRVTIGVVTADLSGYIHTRVFLEHPQTLLPDDRKKYPQSTKTLPTTRKVPYQ
jgi:hypothetical protein